MRTIVAWTVMMLATPAAIGAPNVLAILELHDGSTRERVPILDRAGGSGSPFANKPQRVWTLREGDTLAQPNPPPERLIRFYEIVNNDSFALCTVIVKYSRSANGWRPGYQLLVHPLVTVENGKITPLGSDAGSRGLVQVMNPASPNRDGFYADLSFGTAAGRLTIDAWEVQ